MCIVVFSLGTCGCPLAPCWPYLQLCERAKGERSQVRDLVCREHGVCAELRQREHGRRKREIPPEGPHLARVAQEGAGLHLGARLVQGGRPEGCGERGMGRQGGFVRVPMACLPGERQSHCMYIGRPCGLCVQGEREAWRREREGRKRERERAVGEGRGRGGGRADWGVW
ncbi:hypothetical protein BS50DRAFT_326512 [Corynespora cassiicola Philippines]|uniref:Uncharacterized protein n=1 Tax=Corynespora cassiicola Philippines TaxID=1448308 RepID=A0A2T2NTT4_CORCC|nr:hypothetical protein BS50DRAFT_326512 [Corynespora cassiicola Philippines]